MDDLQRKLARHALGLPNDDRRSYRNRYAFGSMSAIATWQSPWQRMVEAGFAIRGEPMVAGRLIWFYLTEVGARAALEPGETLDPEDFTASVLAKSAGA